MNPKVSWLSCLDQSRGETWLAQESTASFQSAEGSHWKQWLSLLTRVVDAIMLGIRVLALAALGVLEEMTDRRQTLPTQCDEAGNQRDRPVLASYCWE